MISVLQFLSHSPSLTAEGIFKNSTNSRLSAILDAVFGKSIDMLGGPWGDVYRQQKYIQNSLLLTSLSDIIQCFETFSARQERDVLTDVFSSVNMQEQSD